MVTHYHIHLLLTDWLLWIIMLILAWGLVQMVRRPHIRRKWVGVFRRPQGMVSGVVLAVFLLLGCLDSIHFQVTQYNAQHTIIATRMSSVLDLALGPLALHTEKTYSAPLARRSFVKSVFKTSTDKEVRGYAPLQFSGRHDFSRSREIDIGLRLLIGMVLALVITGLGVSVIVGLIACCRGQSWRLLWQRLLRGNTVLAWRSLVVAVMLLLFLVGSLILLAMNYHVFGTNQIGQDVFYETLKSVRTGLLIGVLTTLFTLPLALLLGTAAGYFGGWADDIIQYIYTTLSSIPGVLLISASVLVLQVYISNHPQLFPTLVERADVRLLALCLILGFTSWAGLCRLLRGETLKLREQEFVLAARSLGVRPIMVVIRHIIPNVMHIVLITLVLDFSGLVLAEAVLSYVGVGVDPTMMSWGNMINSSRLELAREPIVWWPLFAAMLFMFSFVLSANLFADTVRDTFDPRS